MAGTTKRKTKTKFFERWDGNLLVRKRNDRAVHEVFGPGTPKWRPFPQADPMHTLEPIGDDRAVELGQSVGGPQVSMGDLESTGVDGDYGDIFESERLPLRP